MHLVLLLISMHRGSSLREFTILVGNKLLLMVETVSDIAVIVSLVCHNLGEILLVLGLSSHWVNILLKG